MTQNDLQLTGRLHALEFLLSQSLREQLRQYPDTEKVEVSARILADLGKTLSSAPSLAQTCAMETADKILKKAVMDSL